MQEALENVKRGGRIGVVAWYTGPVQMDMNLAVRSNVRIYAARGEGGMNSGRSLALMSAERSRPTIITSLHWTRFTKRSGHVESTCLRIGHSHQQAAEDSYASSLNRLATTYRLSTLPLVDLSRLASNL
jgi:hypothetical protein